MKNMVKRNEVRKIYSYIEETGLSSLDSSLTKMMNTCIDSFLERKSHVGISFLTEQKGFSLVDQYSGDELVVSCTPNYVNPEQISVELSNMAGHKTVSYDIYFDEKTVTVDKMEKTLSFVSPYTGSAELNNTDARKIGVYGKNTTTVYVDGDKKYEEAYSYTVGRHPQERANGSSKTITCFLSNGEELRSEISTGEVSSYYHNGTHYEEGDKDITPGEFANKLDAFKSELTKTNAKVFTRGTLGLK